MNHQLFAGTDGVEGRNSGKAGMMAVLPFFHPEEKGGEVRRLIREWKGVFRDGFVSFCGLFEAAFLFMVPAHEN